MEVETTVEIIIAMMLRVVQRGVNDGGEQYPKGKWARGVWGALGQGFAMGFGGVLDCADCGILCFVCVAEFAGVGEVVDLGAAGFDFGWVGVFHGVGV